MTSTKLLLDRIEYLQNQAEYLQNHTFQGEFGAIQVNYADMKSFRTSGLSFILQLFSEKHPYYIEFEREVRDNYTNEIEVGSSILNNIKVEIENGWLTSLKGIISAEIFSDFLEMAEYLLKNNYKDASAVMIGSVLEEHLRQLSIKNGLDTTIEKQDRIMPLSADRLNNNLAKEEIYNKLDQKNITANLDLRNKAAHGKYDEYDKNQVRLMYDSVLNIITRIPI